MAQTEMPIIAYMGVPYWKATDEHYKNLSECGFNVSLYPFNNLETLVKACRIADKYGVRLLANTSDMKNNPLRTAKVLKGEKGFYGYFIEDEPSAPRITELQKTIKLLKTVDNEHCFYINLLPYINPDWIPSSTKVNTYLEYVMTLTKTDCQQISFDHYPVTQKGLRENWYYNLEMIRKASLTSGKPFWGFVLSVPHTIKTCTYPTPTMASLRLQIYSNLAYGAQAIQYFTYWNPGKDEGYDYHDAPISREGNKTKTYFLVQTMNKELRKISTIFYGSKVLSVNHIGKKLPVGTTKMKRLPKNISSLKVISKQGAILSRIQKDGHLYLCVVNKDYKEKMTLNIIAKNNIPVQIEKDLNTSTVKKKYIVEPGDMVLFKLD